MSDSDHAALADKVLNELESIMRSCEENHRPLEMDPARGEIFALFVQANNAGCTTEDGAVDLSADGLCKALSEKWGLKQAAKDSVKNETRIPPEQLEKMRSLWSLMRMWMEWTYAWGRWDEFHSEPL